MLHEDTMPGYCHLQSLQSDVPLPTECLLDTYHIYDHCNRVIFKHTPFSQIFGLFNFLPFCRNGPAVRIKYGTEFDTVIAMRCNNWPPYAAQWINRHRRGQWPTQQLIDQAENDSILLVEVGCKLSQTQDLEWRISFSLTERRLMFSMNITQIKCYIVLKMLMKVFISRLTDDSISSYHCKTAMFYCMEETVSEYWREDNLVECILKCLRLLLTWANNEFCPHFIIPEANLFAGKITPRNKYNIQCVLKDLIESNGRFLLCIPTDKLGYKLTERLSTRPSQLSVLDSLQTIRVVRHTEELFTALNVVYQSSTSAFAPNKLIKLVYQHIHSLIARRTRADTYEKQAIQTLIQLLSVWIGSLLASVSFSCKKGIPREAIHWLGFCAKFDTSSVLKQASIFYCGGDLRNTESRLKDVADIYHVLAHPKDESLRGYRFEHCVVFSPQERYCAPPALRHEFCRSVGDEMLHRVPLKDGWMALAIVDCLPFLYYLQYITYAELGKRVLQKKALQNLEKCLFQDNNFGHFETGLNLLGQCMEQEEKPEDAMRCYRTSLDIRPRNNAANWHVQHLRYQSIRKGGAITTTD